MQNKTTRFTVSSGNVFDDLKFSESEEMIAKAELARQIAVVISRRRLSQIKAARLLESTQPKVSALLNGHLSGFSMERLIRFLTALGQDVEIVVKSKPQSRPQAHLRVTG